MANIEEKFILFLSDPQFSKEEVKKLQMLLTNKKTNTLFKQSFEIKKILSSRSQKNKNELYSDYSTLENKTLSEVNRLLRIEVKMTVLQAVTALCNVLEIKPPSVNKSFQDQILYLIEETSGSEVISAAYKVRNLRAHNELNNDWPLTNNE